MASITTQADAVRSAVASVQTCTPTISATLKELLQTQDGRHDEAASAARPKATKPTAATRKPTTNTKRAPPAKSQAAWTETGLAEKDKIVLATQVINATLKALGEAAKNQPPPSAAPRSRNGLRRSNSSPMTPLQPRSLNRVSTSPAVTKATKTPSSSTASTGCLATVECARAAFSALRTLSSAGKTALPDLQLESGMSSFINKLIALSLYEHALRELRLLKRRLEGIAAGKDTRKAKAPSEPSSTSKTLSDLFDYTETNVPGPVLALIISSQLQALRVMHGLKKSSHLDTVLPFLQPSRPSSPLALLLLSKKGEKSDQIKCAKQLESLAQSLLSLSPSLSPRDDAVAMEPRLSPSPETSVQMQTLALITRLHSWSLSGHKGNVDKDILFPLSVCLSAYSRRSSSDAASKCEIANSAFLQVWERIDNQSLQPAESSKSPLATIYQVLSTTSREAGIVKEAIKWMRKLKLLTTTQEDSVARCCSVTAQLLALSLKTTTKIDESLISEVLDGMRGPLSGSTTELDELLASVCLVRKAAINMVVGDAKEPDDPGSARELLGTVILQIPRFALRWLGKPPASGNDSSAKDLLRFEQRRQILSKQIQLMLDSALMLTKVMLDRGKMPWDLMDPILQDSSALLDVMGDMAASVKSNPSASYHVKISHFYYQQHIMLRQASNSKESQFLRALRRSIDAVKLRPEGEQARAQLLFKQERLAELCRACGRKDDAADALRSIRDSLVREDIVPSITAALSTQGVVQAWKSNPRAESLSRAVCSLAKVDYTPCDWTWLLTGSDKATALEHDLYFVYASKPLVPGDQLVDKLLLTFSVSDHPIRRLRTLLQLLSANLESREEFGNWITEIKSLLELLHCKNLGQDSGLEQFIPHLQGLATCLVTLYDADPKINSDGVEKALHTWAGIVQGSASAEELYTSIDNPPQLATVLQALSDFSRMKGQDTMLGSILQLSADLSRLICTNNPELFVSQNTALCLQYLTVGNSSKVENILKATQEFTEQQSVSPFVNARFHLCSAEYHMAVGNFDLAERHLTDAQSSATSTPTEKYPKTSRLTKKLSIAHASFLHSVLALERGDAHHALYHAKIAVRILFHDWSNLESLRSSISAQGDEPSQVDVSGCESSFASSRLSQADFTRANTGPEFWAMVYPLFRFTLQLSAVYAHVGMYQETMYYAEQAQKVAATTYSESYLAQSQAWLASVYFTAGKTQDALQLATEAKRALPTLEPTCSNIEMACQLSRIFHDSEDREGELSLMSIADSMLQRLGGHVSSEGLGIEETMEKLTIKEKPASRATGRQTKARATAATKKVVPKRGAVPGRAKTPVEAAPIATKDDLQLSFLRASVLRHQSLSMLEDKDWSSAVSALQTAYDLSKLSTDITQERLLMAVALVGQSLEQMGRDSVFSVIQDSTLSFPAVAASKSKSETLSLTKSTPPRKARAASPSSPGFLENLRQAQDYLLEAHSIASLNGNGRLVHRIAILLQNVFLLLSTTSPSKTAVGHPAHATCSVELARNLVWRRERKTLKIDHDKAGKAEWPLLAQTTDPRRSSLGFSIDMNRFQREYVDIIPKSWNVVSISLSDNKHDLCITKLQAGHSPFAIRLPLERASSRDADCEVFNFEQGRAEMLDIIEATNRTCHNARDMSAKGGKSTWWAEREALDERMKDLLENMEQIWLGGFKGIFAQHHRRSDLLARFQKSFQNILDKHLPSRQQVRGKRTKTTATKVSLDPRILDLFIGLGDATIPECDLDEPLTDLLYFVVDILQFHGERNAYDEIDFDSMVVETFDALHAYHASLKSNKDAEGDVHTILILDKAFHIFPWESIPCMQGLAVSRIPSLACLRRSILEQNSPHAQSFDDGDEEEPYVQGAREGHHISMNSGTYILNPSTDLKSTQSTFGRPLASLPPAWTSIETRVPTEDEFEGALTKSDLLLYFGHGSGAQYIRGRTIRKLDKCRAVALLMGCSSASLADVGDFENHGTVWNYMLAGSPAVVGTLWDVTDRDIDRYAGRVFEEWGLMPKGTFAEDGTTVGKGKGKATAGGSSKGRKKAKVVEASEDNAEKATSLVEAVAKAKDACRLRYLTAAAVVVYGIPVYINK
ncbi:uncharacterized protein JN550_000167 [Neoarthrinium moseri]|uniref:uncharacterized protein n=1 Tax=Neoarthrinium moseri TaxID=1658444 RepID=UPI001FDC7EA0|nr:uncharacterized protein JN550_000167 [Neoarthrinium moseri]KAI1877985.1 hypothetical protein JN550_000167 [Neoarthrinium moseri]